MRHILTVTVNVLSFETQTVDNAIYVEEVTKAVHEIAEDPKREPSAETSMLLEELQADIGKTIVTLMANAAADMLTESDKGETLQ